MPTTLVFDNFNRADSPTSLGTANTGQVWSQVSGVSGSFGISSNQALWTWNFGDPTGEVIIESGLVNCITKVTMVDPTTLPIFASGAGIICRWVDSNNYFRLMYFRFPGPTTQLRLQRTYTGSTSTVMDISVTLNAGDTISVATCGTEFEVFINDASQGTYDDVGNPQNYGTQCGLIGISGTFFSTITQRFDDFLVTTNDSCFEGMAVDIPVPIFEASGTTEAPPPPPPPSPAVGQVCWMYDTRELVRGWFPYSFTPAMNVPYFEEGASTLLFGGGDGRLYLYGGDDDAGSDIGAQYDTFTFDGGDPRSNKQFANGSIEAEGDIDIQAIADNTTAILGTTAFNESNRTRETLDFLQDERKNLMLRITGVAPWILYNYSHELTFVSVSERTELRKAFATSMVFNEYANLWRCQLTYISSANIDIIVTADNGSPITYTVLNSGGATVKTQVIFQAIKAKLWEVQFQSDADFQIIRDQSVFFVKEFRSTGPYDQTKPFGDDSRAV